MIADRQEIHENKSKNVGNIWKELGGWIQILQNTNFCLKLRLYDWYKHCQLFSCNQ